MNATNRGVNRVTLLLIGLLLVAVGATAVIAALWPAAHEFWSSRMSTAATWMRTVHAASRLSDGVTASWFMLAALAACALVVVVAVMVIARLGGGRSSTVMRAEAAEGACGAVTIGQGFASDAITRSLAGHAEILSSRVSAHRMWGTDMLHVSVTPRQNTSPRAVAETVTQLVDNLATLTGKETASVVSIRYGLRSRLSADQSRVK